MDSFASWKINGSGMEKEEREETPLQGEDESRRSSPPQETMDNSLEERCFVGGANLGVVWFEMVVVWLEVQWLQCLMVVGVDDL